MKWKTLWCLTVYGQGVIGTARDVVGGCGVHVGLTGSGRDGGALHRDRQQDDFAICAQ